MKVRVITQYWYNESARCSYDESTDEWLPDSVRG